MRSDTLSSLSDMRLAGERILEAAARTDIEALRADRMTQSVFERQFEILGEALVRIRRKEPGVFASVPDHDGIVSMRNFLTHAYEYVDVLTLWRAATEDVPRLLARIETQMPSEPE